MGKCSSESSRHMKGKANFSETGLHPRRSVRCLPLYRTCLAVILLHTEQRRSKHASPFAKTLAKTLAVCDISTAVYLWGPSCRLEAKEQSVAEANVQVMQIQHVNLPLTHRRCYRVLASFVHHWPQWAHALRLHEDRDFASACLGALKYGSTTLSSNLRRQATGKHGLQQVFLTTEVLGWLPHA